MSNLYPRRTPMEYAAWKATVAADLESEGPDLVAHVSNEVLDDLAESPEIAALVARLRKAQALTELDGSSESGQGSQIECVLSHLSMALEAAGVQF